MDNGLDIHLVKRVGPFKIVSIKSGVNNGPDQWWVDPLRYINRLDRVSQLTARLVTHYFFYPT